MKKNLFLTLIVMFFTTWSFAQLSDRQNNPTTFKTGTRPVAGNMGVYIGGTIQNAEKVLDEFSEELTVDVTLEDVNQDASKSRLPVILLKYYKSDDFVIRGAIMSNSKSAKVKGTLSEDVMGISADVELKRKKSEFIIFPGIEKHFASLNILDVYLGADLPLGFQRAVYSQQSGEDSDEQKRFSFTYGIGAFLGIQAFIADLPFSVGCEFAYQGRGFMGNKVKHTEKSGGTTQTYYTEAGDDSGTAYSDLKASQFIGSTNVNFFISYYFNR